MTIDIESPKVDVSETLDTYIREKVSKLEHYYERALTAVVYLHDNPDHKEVEIKLLVPNDTLFVKEQGDSFNAALDMAYDTMKRNIKRYREKTLQSR